MDVFQEGQDDSELEPKLKEKNAPNVSTLLIAAQSRRKELLVSLVLAAILTPLAYWFWTPSAIVVDESDKNTLVDRFRGFALTAPADWIKYSPAQIPDAMRRLGERVLPSAARLDSSLNLVVGFFQNVQEGAFASSVNLVVLNSPPPPIDAQGRDEAAKQTAALYQKYLPGYQFERAQIVEVDKLAAILLVGQATIERPQKRQVQIIQYLIPGKNHTYLLSFSREAGAQQQQLFSQIIKSFRVLDRPPRWGNFLHWTVGVGAIASILACLFFVVYEIRRWLAKRGANK